MSLVSFAVRLIVCRALTGKTFAGNRVLNSPVEPLEDLLADGAPAIPLIAVFTNNFKREGPGRDMTGDENTLGLTIQVLIPPTVEVAGIAFEARGAGAAALLDFVWRQVTRALVVETGTWAKLFARFVAQVKSVTVTPTLYELTEEGRRGIRIPAHEFSLECRTVTEPMWGRPLANHWLELDTAMRAEPALVALADLVKEEIEQPDGMPDWRVLQAAFGMSDAAMLAAGLKPIDTEEEGEGPPISEIAVEPPGIIVDEPEE